MAPSQVGRFGFGRTLANEDQAPLHLVKPVELMRRDQTGISDGQRTVAAQAAN